MSGDSFYDLLEVSTNATSEEIDTSYQRIMSYLDTSSLAMYSMLEEDEVGRMRTAVDQAYQTLSDPERRAAYDLALSRGDDYFSVMVPEVQSDATLSVGSVAGAEPVLPSTQPPVVRAAPPAARQPSTPPAPAPQRAVARKPAERSPPRIRRLKPTLDIELRPDTEFSGALLRRLRESAGATLGDVGEITKISKRYLRAIEENDFSSLPAAVYVRGFVSEYARALGLDNRAVAKSYMALYQRYRQEGNR